MPRFSAQRTEALEVLFERGESIHAEADALVTMSGGLEVTGRLSGGIFSGIMRKLSGESFFVQSIEAHDAGAALLAPPEPGEVAVVYVDDTRGDIGKLYLKRGAYLAGDASVKVSTCVQSGLVKSMFSGTGIFIMETAGVGQLAISGFAGLYRYELQPGERRSVDNGHLVAWSKSISYTVGLAKRGSYANSFMSGEGLMCHLTGPGTVYVQARNPDAFRAWVLRPGAGNNGMQVVGFGIIVLFLLLFFVAIIVAVVFAHGQAQ